MHAYTYIYTHTHTHVHLHFSTNGLFFLLQPDDCLACYDPHGYCVIYSASDRESFNVAEHILQVLWTNQNIAQKAVILVANKADLARSRLISADGWYRWHVAASSLDLNWFFVICRRESHGNSIRLQVHRDLCGYKSQRWRVAGGVIVTNTLKIGESWKIQVSWYMSYPDPKFNVTASQQRHVPQTFHS